MHVRQVVALEIVVHVDLPVAGHFVGDAAAKRVAGQARAQADVDSLRPRGEVHARIEGGEHQSLPLHHGHLGQADVLGTEPGRVGHVGRGAQTAVEAVVPAVVAAAQGARAAPVAQGQRSGAVAADVVQAAQDAVLAAHDQQRHAGDLTHQVVAGLGHAFGRAEQLPTACEYG